MRTRDILGFLFSAGLLLSACGPGQPQLVTVEVTQIVRETQPVTVEVTRIVRKTKIVTAKVTRIVRETVIVTPTPIEAVAVAPAPVEAVTEAPAPTEAVEATPALPFEWTINLSQGIALSVPHALHTATRLSDGRILLVGGSQSPNEPLTQAEIFDSTTGLITQVAQLHTPRHEHTATLLQDGRVLVVGGYNQTQQWLDDAEVYDLSADTWTIVPPLYSHGVRHTATLMEDGRVLVVGGCIGSSVCTERVEIFNPQTNSWTEARPLEGWLASHTAQLLEDGRVLIASDGGGPGAPAGGNALLYDPQTNDWTATGPMVRPRIFAQSVLLPDSRVLLAGGMTLEDEPAHRMSASAEIYDPDSNTWTAAAPLSQARYLFVLALLPDGQVLAVGGAREYDNVWTGASFVHQIESYDPLTDRWHTAGELPRPGANAAAALLPDGRLWVTGGQAGQAGSTFWLDTWLIAPLPSPP